MANKYLDQAGLQHYTQLVQGMADGDTIEYSQKTGESKKTLHLKDGIVEELMPQASTSTFGKVKVSDSDTGEGESSSVACTPLGAKNIALGALAARGSNGAKATELDDPEPLIGTAEITGDLVTKKDDKTLTFQKNALAFLSFYSRNTGYASIVKVGGTEIYRCEPESSCAVIFYAEAGEDMTIGSESNPGSKGISNFVLAEV